MDAAYAKYWVRTVSDIDMFDPDLSEVVRGRGQTINEHTLKISYGGGYATTLKGDFDLNKNGAAVGGTITKIEFEDDPHYGTIMSGLRVDLSAFIKAAKSNPGADDAKLLEVMFAKNDVISGGIGDDKIKGFAGNDKVIGGFGDDALDGGDGTDTLVGGDDADLLTGGDGADVFFYDDASDSAEQFGIDIIQDFSQAQGDKISLIDVGFFDFATDIEITHQNGDTIVRVDTEFQIGSFMIIRVDGDVSLTMADFIL